MKALILIRDIGSNYFHVDSVTVVNDDFSQATIDALAREVKEKGTHAALVTVPTSTFEDLEAYIMGAPEL